MGLSDARAHTFFTAVALELSRGSSLRCRRSLVALTNEPCKRYRAAAAAAVRSQSEERDEL